MTMLDLSLACSVDYSFFLFVFFGWGGGVCIQGLFWMSERCNEQENNGFDNLEIKKKTTP